MQQAGVPGILDVIGVGMLGPTIIAHGTEEQKQRYLGPMLHADEIWCQMFSEPAAGSDLAAVQTRAKHNDDGTWTLNGQKVWTTNAQFASYGLLLARTNPDIPKHKGMTMFIVPMMAVAGSLAAKKIVPTSAGTFPTHGGLFVGLLIGVILIVGGLTFFPALSLGPIVEHLAMQAGTFF